MQDLQSGEGAVFRSEPPRAGAADGFRLWSMCFALFGIQIVWGLQNANTSRIFQALGADVAELPLLWIAGPITGLIVQPIIGHLSDHSRSRHGRRRPFLVAGGLLSALALVLMPNAATLWAAIAALWLLTASNNIAMDPSRALVADNLPHTQRARGYAVQVFFIGTGAVFASSLPWVLVNWFGVSGVGEAGGLPSSVRYAFYIGAACLLASMLWTVLTTRERPADASLRRVAREGEMGEPPVLRRAWALAAGGAGLLAVALARGWQWEVALLAGAALLVGAAEIAVARRRARGDGALGMLQIVEDFRRMPRALRQLALVQFFTWFALFAMWIYAAPAVARAHYGTGDAASAPFNAAADWVGMLFAGYNAVAALAALALPGIAARIGERQTYALCLLCGAAGMAGFVILPDPDLLWLASLGIGLAWAAVLSLPYAIIVGAVAPGKVGVYLGIHNIFLVVPQLVAAVCLGPAIRHLFGGEPGPALALAGGLLVLAAGAALFIGPRAEVGESAA
ncbi:MFS transporter [Sphingopyxis panaciterrulae]|uniref:Maltose/moltooligosaccharide transporter n=1 Tax=Sphingopyxis panaciterrulae TaxID=462372 RepID=A0A7W9EQA1_9SPHN|nr:MFS transporter [Sphingopyxis panaciterrulae]MBB5706408.1 maltose/moltooligosaccharide transporter [Sphingopyxis panaciterrulae]